MNQEEGKKSFWARPFTAWLFLIIFWPVGIYLFWAHDIYSKKVRIALSLILLTMWTYGVMHPRIPAAQSSNPIPKEAYMTAKDSVILEDLAVEVSMSGNYLTINGSIRNKGIRPIQRVILRCTSSDKNGRVVDSSNIYVRGEIRPNESKAFSHVMKNLGTDTGAVIESASF